MGQTNRIVSVPLTITSPGTLLDVMTGARIRTQAISAITGNGTKQALQLSTTLTDHVVTNNTTGSTWTATSMSPGASQSGNTASITTITFSATPTPAAGSTVTFLLKVASVPARADDMSSESFGIAPMVGATAGTFAAASGDLKRYGLEITGITPPATSAVEGSVVSPVMTVANRSTAAVTLVAAPTAIGGSAFQSTGTEGAFSAINAGASGTVTYTSAQIASVTSDTTLTVTGSAGDAAARPRTAPGFTKNVTVTDADVTAPYVVSINRTATTPTNTTGSLTWTATFSESVTGVDTTDFAVANSGLGGSPAVTGVTGSGTTYTVTASTGTGSGTLGVNLTDNDSIQDAALNNLGASGGGADGSFAGQTYTIDRAKPTSTAAIINSIQSSTSIAVIHDGADSGGAVLSKVELWVETPDAGTVYELAATDNDPTITQSFTHTATDGDGTYSFYTLAYDTAGNVQDVPGTAHDSIVIDNSAPSVSSITRVATNPTNASSVQFTVTFSESVTGVGTGDFSVANSTGVIGAAIDSVTGSGASYTVTVDTGSGSGTIDLDLIDDDTITDGATNMLGGTGTSGAGDGSFTTGQTYTIDRSAPSVTSINRKTGQANPTNADSVIYTVVFSESVTPVVAGDFELTATGTAAGTVASVSGSGTTYDVTVNSVTGNGTLRLDLDDSNSTITDTAGNSLSTTTHNGDQTFTIDNSSPSVTSITRADTNPTNASSVQFTVAFSEPVTGVGTGDFSLAGTGTSGASITSVSADSGTTRTVTVATGADGTLGLNLVDDDTITDGATNELGGTGAGNGNFTGQTYIVDTAAPSVTSIDRVATSPTNTTGSLTWTATFSESVTGVDTTDFTVADSGLGGTPAITGVTGSGTTYTVTASTGTGSGTLRVDLDDDDSIVDAAGNALRPSSGGGPNGSFAGQTYTIDRTDPTSSATITNATQSSTSIVVAHDGADSGGAALDKVELWVETPDAGTAYELATTDTTPTVSQNFTYSATDGDGTYSFYTLAYDSAGNFEDVPGAADDSIVIDSAAPSVTSIDRVAPNPTNTTGSLTWTVTFSEAVTGVDTTDFTVADSGLGGTPAVTGVTGSGTTYTVTASTGTGSGTLRLDLDDNNSIVDAATNSLRASGGGANGSFTGQTYTIDRTKPTSSAAIANATQSSTSIAVTHNGADSGGAALSKVELYVKSPLDLSFSLTDTDTTPAVSQSFTYSAADGNGTYSFYTLAYDTAGNVEVDAGVADDSIVIDNGAPNTTIDSGPSGTISTNSATFTFSADEASTFRCRLEKDAAVLEAFTACNSGTKTYNSLGNDDYIFTVEATDSIGNVDATPATRSFTVDSSSATLSASASPTLIRSGQSSTITFASDRNGTYSVRVGGTNCTDGTEVATGSYTTSPSDTTATVAAAELAEGANTIRVCLTPTTGTLGSATTSVTLDSTAPQTTIASGPSGTIATDSATFTFSSNETNSTFSCLLERNGSVFETFTACNSGTKSYTSLTDGNYVFHVGATDPAGNADGSAATRAFTVSLGTTLQAPTADSASVTVRKNDEQAITLGGSDPQNDPLTFKITTLPTDGTLHLGADASGPALTAADLPAVVGSSDTVTYEADNGFTGDDSFTFVANDGTNDSAPATISISVVPNNVPPPPPPPPDATPPAAPSTPDLVSSSDLGFSDTDDVTNDTTPVVAGIAEPGSKVAMSLDGSFGTEVLADAVTGIYEFALTLADGDHIMAVRATDGAGNIGASSTTLTITVDTVGPAIQDTRSNHRYISPNGDGKAEALKVGAVFDEPVEWTFSVAPSLRATPDRVTAAAAGDDVIFEVTGRATGELKRAWRGATSDGAQAPEGSYSWELSGIDVAGNPFVPVEKFIGIDRTAPVVQGLRVAPNPFRPAKHHQAQLLFALTEPGHAFVRIKRLGVRKGILHVSVRLSTPGDIRISWDGRDMHGRRVEPGRYMVVIKAVDRAKNLVLNRSGRIRVTR